MPFLCKLVYIHLFISKYVKYSEFTVQFLGVTHYKWLVTQLSSKKLYINKLLFLMRSMCNLNATVNW